jgi:hypothetical protein
MISENTLVVPTTSRVKIVFTGFSTAMPHLNENDNRNVQTNNTKNLN